MNNRPKQADWIDIHSHLKGGEPGVYRVFNLHLEDFTPQSKDGPFSCALHPWHIANNNELLNPVYKLEEVVRHPNLVGIGEAGLDKIIPVDMKTQLKIFSDHISISEKFRFPMIIHCVKAFQELLKIRKDMNVSQPWILHGFNSSPQLASDLIKKGFRISAGPRIMNNPARCRKILSSIPEESLYIESDEEETGISKIYSAIAECKSMSVDKLRSQVYNNFINDFLR